MYLCVYEDDSVDGYGFGDSVNEAYVSFCEYGDGGSYTLNECRFYECKQVEVEIKLKKVSK